LLLAALPLFLQRLVAELLPVREVQGSCRWGSRKQGKVQILQGLLPPEAYLRHPHAMQALAKVLMEESVNRLPQPPLPQLPPTRS